MSGSCRGIDKGFPLLNVHLTLFATCIDTPHVADLALTVDDMGRFVRNVNARSTFITRLATYTHRFLLSEWTVRGPAVPGSPGFQFLVCAMTATRAAPCALLRSAQ